MYTKIAGTVFLIAVVFTGFQLLSSESEYVRDTVATLTNLELTITAADIPLETQVGQLFAVGHWPNIPTRVTTKRVADLQLGSVIVMAAPRDDSNITEWTTNWQASSSIPLLISIDQEGGIVSRLKGADHIQTAQSKISTTEQAFDVAQNRGQALRALGINANYAPVLDQSVLPTSFMYPRVFRDPQSIAMLGDAMVRGYTDGGVVAVPKHFPGHPDTSDDSHITLPQLDLTTAEYIAHTQQFTDIITAGNVEILMTAHVLVPTIDPDFPATVSSVVISDLRDRVGYDGVVVTDDLAMQAISDRWSHEEAAVLALQAGVDMVMLAAEPQHASSTVAAVIAAVESGELSRARVFEAYSRVMEVKERL